MSARQRPMSRLVSGCLLLAALLCLGMGGLGEREMVTKIPKPDRFFSVELVDAEDVSFQLREFSMEGLTLLPVAAGRALISLDFAKIREARFFLHDDKVRAVVEFQNSSSQEFLLDQDLSFFGLTDWGKVNIKAGDVRRITFIEQGVNPQAD